MLNNLQYNKLANRLSNIEPDYYDIPESHQKLVIERFENARKNPESLVDWEEAKKIMNVK